MAPGPAQVAPAVAATPPSSAGHPSLPPRPRFARGRTARHLPPAPSAAAATARPTTAPPPTSAAAATTGPPPPSSTRNDASASVALSRILSTSSFASLVASASPSPSRTATTLPPPSNSTRSASSSAPAAIPLPDALPASTPTPSSVALADMCRALRQVTPIVLNPATKRKSSAALDPATTATASNGVIRLPPRSPGASTSPVPTTTTISGSASSPRLVIQHLYHRLSPAPPPAAPLSNPPANSRGAVRLAAATQWPSAPASPHRVQEAVRLPPPPPLPSSLLARDDTNAPSTASSSFASLALAASVNSSVAAACAAAASPLSSLGSSLSSLTSDRGGDGPAPPPAGTFTLRSRNLNSAAASNASLDEPMELDADMHASLAAALNIKKCAPISILASLTVNNDYCESCRGHGSLLCCERCPKAFHLLCLDPPLDYGEMPEGSWYCKPCTVASSAATADPQRAKPHVPLLHFCPLPPPPLRPSSSSSQPDPFSTSSSLSDLPADPSPETADPVTSRLRTLRTRTRTADSAPPPRGSRGRGGAAGPKSAAAGKRAKPAPPITTLFASLAAKLDVEDPRVFSLPARGVLNAFAGIVPDYDGEFSLTGSRRQAPGEPGSAPAAPLPQLQVMPVANGGTVGGAKDAKSRLLLLQQQQQQLLPSATDLCYACTRRVGPHRRLAVRCAQCPLVFHLDCLDPPWTVSPGLSAGDGWQCPCHAAPAGNRIGPGSNSERIRAIVQAGVRGAGWAPPHAQSDDEKSPVDGSQRLLWADHEADDDEEEDDDDATDDEEEMAEDDEYELVQAIGDAPEVGPTRIDEVARPAEEPARAEERKVDRAEDMLSLLFQAAQEYPVDEHDRIDQDAVAAQPV
ncbi:PHD finger protein 12 [Blastocladiella emersonii ATCC 22665]|nr:PHD finger protein 12 [Blastocladiella emersonii ATCC 22665]